MRQVVLLMAILVLAVAASPAAAEDRVVFNDERTLDPGAGGGLDGLTAYAGTFAWLGNDGAGSHLRLRAGDRQEEATAEPFQDPSEGGLPIDLGPGRRGPLAVYPRCGGLCEQFIALFIYDVRHRRERRPAIAAHARRDHWAGAAWNGRLAFSRQGQGRDERRYAFWARGPVRFGNVAATGLLRRRLPSRRCRSRGRAQIGRRLPSELEVDSIAVDRGRAFYEDGYSIRELTDPPLRWR